MLLHSWNSPHHHEKEYITNDRIKNVKNLDGKGVGSSQWISQSQEVPCNWTVFLHATHNQKEQKRCEVPTNIGKYPHSHNYQYEHYELTERAQEHAIDKGYVGRKHKYYLSILAMFKNEAEIMKEWLDHHIAHGVEHFYLIDDYSTDNVLQVLVPYLEKGYVSLHAAPFPSIPFRQVAAYHKTFTYSILARNESKWVAVIDLDEFLYSPIHFDVTKVLKEHEDLAVAGVNWIWFGSSGIIQQPKSVIDSFLYRADYDFSKYPNLTAHYKILRPHQGDVNDWQKNIINTDFRVHSIEVHQAYVEGISDNLSVERYRDNPPLMLNHYSIQSREFFIKNKGTRGDSNGYYSVSDRNMAWFKVCDINDVLDERLKKQNEGKFFPTASYGVIPPDKQEPVAPTSVRPMSTNADHNDAGKSAPKASLFSAMQNYMFGSNISGTPESAVSAMLKRSKGTAESERDKPVNRRALRA